MNLTLVANLCKIGIVLLEIIVILFLVVPNLYEFLRVSFRRVYYRKEIAAQKAQEAYYQAHPEARPVCRPISKKEWDKSEIDSHRIS